MQTKANMRRPISLQVHERKTNPEGILRQMVIQRKIHLSRVLRFFNAIAGQIKPHRAGTIIQDDFWIGELLGSQETMVSAADFVTLVERTFPEEAVDIISH